MHSLKVRSMLGLVALGALTVACSKEATPSAAQPSPDRAAEAPGATGAGDEGAAGPAEGKASYSETNFALTLESAGEYEKGKAGSAEILLEAKPPFHANDKYPYKLKLADSPGMSFPETVVTKDKAKVEHMQVTMPVAFTATETGKRKIGGVFQFSVCSEDKCLIEKRNLALEVEVK